MFIFIFLCCFLTTERVYCKIREIATFLEALEFRSIFTCMCKTYFFPVEILSVGRNLILIGYYTVVCTIWKWKYIVRVCIVLKTRIGRGVESNTSFQYNTDEYNIFPYCTYHCIITYLLYS